MRKWMKDRLKRRSKGAAAAKERTPAPEPLQPKYFDNDLPEKTSAAAAPHAAEPESEPPAFVRAEAAPEIVVQGPSEPGSVKPPAKAPMRPSRRRRRGGRSSGRRAAVETAVPVTAPQSVVEAAPVAAAEALPIPDAVVAGPPAPASADTVAAELRPAAPQPVPKPSKGAVVLAIGLPGSGKSSWFKRHNIRPLSSDLLRELLFDDAEEQRFQDLVFSNLRAMLKARLIARRPMSYIDATNLNPHERHSWIKLAKDYGYDVQGLFFDVPLEVCLERHARRGREVPEDIMRKMAAKLRPPTFDEGFSKITVVRVKKKEGETTGKSAE